NFHVTFSREGYFMTTDAYDYIPVVAAWCNPEEVNEGTFIFKLIDEDHYSLAEFSNDQSEKATVFAINDSIQFDEYSLCIRKVPHGKINAFIDVPFLLTIKSP